MKVHVNGEPRDLDEASTLATLLQELDTTPQRVAIEVNRELVTRKDYGQTHLNDGGNIEIVTFVGGG